MMAAFIRVHVSAVSWPLALSFVVVVVLAALAAGCTPVNAPDPATTKQKFRADLALFCLRNPEAIGCEKFSKGVRR